MPRIREHEYFCRKCGSVVVIEAELGTAPATPKCEVCEQPMAKNFGAPQVNYVRKWRISMGR